MTIAYLLDLFPILSETFIVREILELQKQHKVLVFARNNTADHVLSEVIHSDTNKLIKDVQYLSSLIKGAKIKRWGLLILYHLYFLLRNPIRYVKTFWFSFNHGKKIFATFIFSVFYARELIKAGVGHMHVHFALEACTNAMLISMYTGISYSFTAHAHDIFIPQLADLLEEKFNNAKYAICISEYNKNYVLKKFPSINPGKIRIVHCGLDLSAFTPRTGKINKQFNILSIGRLVEHKGFKYLVQACKLLKEHSGLTFVCNIIGEGKDRQELEELISMFDLKKEVNLLGSREQTEVMTALKGADLFVLPCVVEENGMQDGIPVSLMESMAIGIPVISTRISGVPELIKNGAGILVEPANAEELSAAMEQILGISDKEKEIMIRKERKIIEDEFNLEKEVAKLAELVNS